jgi:hypothetical protein
MDRHRGRGCGAVASALACPVLQPAGTPGAYPGGPISRRGRRGAVDSRLDGSQQRRRAAAFI